MSGMLSWIRKYFSAEWWRNHCQCLRRDDSGNFDKRKEGRDLPMTVEFHDIRSAHLSGISNPSFYLGDPSTRREDIQKVEVPTIEVQPPPPPEYSSLERDFQIQGRDSVDAPGYYENSYSYRGSYRPRAKITSQPSITSDYVSDAESEYYHTVLRPPNEGRYSSRRLGQKKRLKPKPRHHQRAGSTRSYIHSTANRNHSHAHKMRKYPTGPLSNMNSFEPRKPISRRHSLAHTASPRENENLTNVNLSISIKRPKEPSSSRRSVRERQTIATIQQNMSSGARPKVNSFNHGNSIATRNQETIPPGHLTTAHNSSSHTPTTHKPVGLVRNETILEVPIYLKASRPKRPASAHVVSTSENTTTSLRPSRPQKKTRHHKPPRSHKDRSNGHDHPIRIPRSEKWLYGYDGYASLPASWNNIEPDKLQRAGLTRESLMESLERLDFEKLCRPVPSISNEQQLKTPRKSLVQSNAQDDEKEVLKDTYKLERFNIVSTDL